MVGVPWRKGIMKVLVHLVQSGGCDYTIGCGHRVQVVTVPDMETAKNRVLEELLKDMGEDNLRSLRRIDLYPIGTPEEIDVAVVQGILDTRERERKEWQEREEFERLKKKYGGG